MSYQPIYDAVKSSLGNPDISGAVENVARSAFDISWLVSRGQEAIAGIESDMRAPHVLMRPRLFIDGNKWCALYGDNLQDGVAGFGDSPDAACLDFNNQWTKNLEADNGKD